MKPFRLLTPVVAGLLMLVVTSLAAVEPRDFSSPEEEARFAELTEELRCTVCQNQSLADSDAPLARDLRDEVQTMLQQGNSDEEIKRFLVERYGDFVLYRPPVRGNTLLLWLAPLLLLTTGAVVMAFTIHRHRVMLAEEALAEVDGAWNDNDTDDGYGDGDRYDREPGASGDGHPAEAANEPRAPGVKSP